MKRAYTFESLKHMSFNSLQFEGKWHDLIGDPAPNGVWFVWGRSGQGKTTFLVELCRYMANFQKTAYNTLEEGARLSFQKALTREKRQHPNDARILILNRESMEDLYIRLSRRHAPKCVVIDSLQYAGLTKKTYKQLQEDFPKTLFIINGHAKGKEPKGALGEDVQFDADVKIYVEGFTAFARSRFLDNSATEMQIVPHLAEQYWKKQL